MAIVNLQAMLSIDDHNIDVDKVIELLQNNKWDESVHSTSFDYCILGSSPSLLLCKVKSSCQYWLSWDIFNDRWRR